MRISIAPLHFHLATLIPTSAFVLSIAATSAFAAEPRVCKNGIIGLPNSAQTQMFQQDFDMGGVTLEDEDEATPTDPQTQVGIADDLNQQPASVKIGASYSGIGDTDAIVAPLDYKKPMANGAELLINVPFMYIEHTTPSEKPQLNVDGLPIRKSFSIGDATETGFDTTTYYGASLGAGYKLPVSKWIGMKNTWALTPLARFGGVASDIGTPSPAFIYSGGALSEYDLRLAGGVLGIKNMISYYGISPLNVHNAIFRNGLYYAHYLGPQLFRRKLSGTLFFTDTRFAGSALYMDSMQQVGFNFGLAPKRSKTGSFIRRTIDAQDIRLGMTYTYSSANNPADPNLDGFAVNLGYTF